MDNTKDLYLDVTIAALTKVFDLAESYDHNDVAALLDDAVTGRRTLTRPGSNKVNASYSIHATLRMPVDEKIIPIPTVQILVHGLTYDKHYWTGLQEGENSAVDKCDWTLLATRKGYYTLNIDRLGCGKSTRPDPVREVQDAVQAEVLHEIIEQLRSGFVDGIKFSRVIVVGHSYGSILGSIVSDKYPTDIDDLVLTGWTKADMNVEGNELFRVQVPAGQVYPSRFGSLEPGYLVIGQQVSREKGCFAGSYDASIANLDWSRQEVNALGELASTTIVSRFPGNVCCIVGHEDHALATYAMGTGTVEDADAQATREVFPSARVCGWHVVPDTGHCISLHHSAESTAELVFRWLDRIESMSIGVDHGCHPMAEL
ncbi:hypothetical protein Q7P35_008232 [Cladosporium inversicolor]